MYVQSWNLGSSQGRDKQNSLPVSIRRETLVSPIQYSESTHNQYRQGTKPSNNSMKSIYDTLHSRILPSSPHCSTKQYSSPSTAPHDLSLPSCRRCPTKYTLHKPIYPIVRRPQTPYLPTPSFLPNLPISIPLISGTTSTSAPTIASISQYDTPTSQSLSPVSAANPSHPSPQTPNDKGHTRPPTTPLS